jgi:hypothetical protein
MDLSFKVLFITSQPLLILTLILTLSLSLFFSSSSSSFCGYRCCCCFRICCCLPATKLDKSVCCADVACPELDALEESEREAEELARKKWEVIDKLIRSNDEVGGNIDHCGCLKKCVLLTAIHGRSEWFCQHCACFLILTRQHCYFLCPPPPPPLNLL